MAKLTPQKEQARFYYALFSKSGFDERIMEEAKDSEELRIYDLEAVRIFQKEPDMLWLKRLFIIFTNFLLRSSDWEPAENRWLQAFP